MKSQNEEILAKDACFVGDKCKLEELDSIVLKEESSSKANSTIHGRPRRKGFRVSENGGRSERGFNIEAALEDSEMKGASTLLKMQRSGGGERLRGLGSVLDAIDSNETKGRNKQRSSQTLNGLLLDATGIAPDSGDKLREFAEGDFVWGKIKSHPWWPGRVYDPCNASEHAKKVKQGDKILVAYFGDGTFAWCNPSQLKPLKDDFEGMLKQSASKHFLNAIETLLDELGTVLALKMACSCMLQDNSSGFGRTLADNAGVREGALIPDRGVNEFFDSLKPSNCLSLLKDFARHSSVDNVLELTILKSWLSVFYRWNGVYPLPSYHDPLSITGLDDETRDVVKDLNCSSGEDQGEDIHSPAGGGAVQPSELDSPSFPKSLLQKCQEVPEDRQYQRRKQKSLAEIIGGTSIYSSEALDDKTERNMLHPAERKKFKDERGREAGKLKNSSDEDDNEGKTGLLDELDAAARGDSSASISGMEFKDDDEAAVHLKSTNSPKLIGGEASIALELNDSANVPISNLLKCQSLKHKKRKDRDQEGEAGEARETSYSPRQRKKSKYLSAPYTSVGKVQMREFLMKAEPQNVSYNDELGELAADTSSTLPEPSLLPKAANEEDDAKRQQSLDSKRHDQDEEIFDDPFHLSGNEINVEPQLRFVRVKLQVISAMLETPGVEMTACLKAKLQDEIEDLLEKVKALDVPPPKTV